MGHKKIWLPLLTVLLAAIAFWLLRDPPEDISEAIDYKELYRQTFHTQAADMEAAQRKRWNDSQN